eukprot:1363199-Alexandrium_andersonii.AAC.1
MDAMHLASTASWGTAHLTGRASWYPRLPCRKRGPPARRPAEEKRHVVRAGKGVSLTTHALNDSCVQYGTPRPTDGQE